MVHKRKEVSLEDFYINRFGKKLYSMFFEHYTENVWGRHPSQMTAEWGAQRVKGVSITAVLKDAVGKAVHLKGKKNGEVETSLIEEFSYPKYGPGQLWEITADEIVKKGGRIELGACVKKIHKAKGRVLTGVTWERDGESFEESGDIFISSMPIKDLVGGMNNVPEKAAAIAAGLPYRDYMTVGVLVPGLKLKNKTKIPTIGNIVPDDWVYVHDRSVKMGRFQIFNNWSPYMVADIEHTVWVGLEYFCNEGDEMWSMSDEDFAKMGVSEMVKIGMIDSEDEVIDSHVERVKKAYPAYFDTYDQIGRLRRYLDKIPNLYCVGRNGQHRYNNLDHSMMTSFEAVKNIRTGSTDRSNIWNVNTEKSYHEKK
jgi:protoporphyrinogen oxidase